MRAKIIEFAISNFQHIYYLDKTKKRLSGKFINLWGDTTHIVASFNQRSSIRPNLKKLGIYVKLIFKSLEELFDEIYYRQILDKYLQSIGWNDLQYIAFICLKKNSVEIDIILNRVISSTQIIDLKSLKVNWIQYEILQKAYTDICTSLRYVR